MTRDELQLALRRAQLPEADITAALREAAPSLEDDDEDDTDETASDITDAAGLTVHGIDRDVFDKLPPSERISIERRAAPPAPSQVHPHRPVTRALTAEELAALDASGLTGPARTERARVLQQTPLPEG
jgi:hypothetical protein